MESNGISTENQVKLTKESCPSNNLSSDHVLNGFSNGINSKSNSHHKHKHKNKDKDKDREKHRDKHKHKDKEKDRDQEKHRHDEKEKQKSCDESKKEKSERKEKEHRSKEKDDQHHKEKNHSSSEKEKELKDKSKEHHKEKHKSSSKDKEHKTSSSSSKHSSGDKHHSSSKDKEKHKDKHKHSKHSSSDKSSVAKHGTDNKEKQNDKINDSSVVERVQDTKLDEKVDIKEEPVEDFSDNNSTVNSQSDVADDKDELRMTIKKEPTSQMNSFGERDFDNEVEDDSMPSFGGVSEEETALLKTEEESEDDIPLNQRSSFSSVKRKIKQEDEEEDSEEDIPLMARKKIKQEKNEKKRKAIYSDDENSDDYEKKKKPKPKKIKKEPKNESLSETPTKKKKAEEEQEVWRWWEEEKKDDGVKWNFLEHKGPMFAPPYEPLPSDIKFYYDGKEMKLSQDAEEIATFYAKLIEHEYTTKEAFNKNFFKDWRKSMTPKEKEIITDLKKCDFRKIHAYFVQKSEERKAMSKEEKKKIKEENEEIIKIYGFCIVDGHKEKIGNFKIEPPGLFRGRGEHPKMGMLKRRVVPEDVIINCSKDSKVPDPPAGHKWKDVRHDNTVTWLASWTENVQGQVKYVMLNPSSKLKGEKDWQKYETARKLAKCVDKIRREYREDWKSKEMRIRQRAVAMYFIDKLALRAGNEKDEDQADTVGCCSLRVEHIQLHEEKDGKNYVVVFDFLGKDSIRYYNEVPVEKRVFKNLQLFVERKTGNDDLFDRLNTAVLNKHLNELMEGLTAKVFRTYNASITLQNQLNELTDPNATVPEKILQYNRANRAVAILCNHQRSIPKSHEKSMGNLKQKIDAKKEQIQIAMRQYKDAKREAKDNSSHSKMVLDKKKKALERLKEQLVKLEVQETDKEENKTIALGTSKLNYLDPRISVAWCKKHNVPIEKIYNKTQRSKFRWAIDMAGPEYVF